MPRHPAHIDSLLFAIITFIAIEGRKKCEESIEWRGCDEQDESVITIISWTSDSAIGSLGALSFPPPCFGDIVSPFVRPYTQHHHHHIIIAKPATELTTTKNQNQNLKRKTKMQTLPETKWKRKKTVFGEGKRGGKKCNRHEMEILKMLPFARPRWRDSYWSQMEVESAYTQKSLFEKKL